MKCYILYASAVLLSYASAETIQSCDSSVYCQGKLLDTIQSARIFSDSKTFVDMSQRQPPDETLKNFKKFMAKYNDNPTKDDIIQFVEDNFVDSKQLVDWTPPDFKEDPDFLDEIKDLKIKEFATTLVNIWPNLARKVDDSVSKHQEMHSLIYLPNGFVIPGGRFKEIYYWDTYWIIKGLLLGEMTETVKGILENFLSLVDRYGFVPNGSRVYYLNRSQPPLLSLMVGMYIDATSNKDWLRTNIGIIEKEVMWFVENRMIDVNGHKMARYACQSGTPRPESYYEDKETCRPFKGKDKEKCYKNLKSGAESGWDFSSRWILNEDGYAGSDIAETDTFRVIPVDLNAFLCKAFQEISRFYSILGDDGKAQEWSGKARKLQKGIQKLLYSEDDGVWYDFDIKSGQPRKNFYPTNLAPLWAGTFDKESDSGQKVVQYLKKNGIEDFKGGVPTSMVNSGEQWDMPNAWPPLQEIVVLGLKNTNDSEAVELAEELAKRYVESCMLGYDEHHAMYEKYDAFTPGATGGGGEYKGQTGFGWTNGLALSLIDLFYRK